MKEKIKKTLVLLCAASLMTGGLTACGGESQSTQSSTQSTVSEQSVVSDDSTVNSNTEESSNSDESNGSSDNSDEESKEEKKLDYNLIRSKINEYMTALKNGDIETLRALSTDTRFYDELAQPEEVKKILAALYGNMIWTTDFLTDDDIEREYNFSINFNSSFEVPFYVGSRRFMYYSEYDLLRYKKGDVIPDGFKYATDEEAWQAFNATLEKMPLLFQKWILKVSFSDDGNITFEPYLCDYEHFLDESYTLSNAREGNTLIDLLEEVGNDYCVVSPDGVEIEHNDESGGGVGLRQQTVDLMKEKKFREAYELILSKDEDIDQSFKYAYDDFNDNQKAYVQSVIDDCNVYPIEVQRGTNKYKSVELLVDCSVFKNEADDDVMKWIEENKLRDLYVEYCTTYMSLDQFFDKGFDFYYSLILSADFVE